MARGYGPNVEENGTERKRRMFGRALQSMLEANTGDMRTMATENLYEVCLSDEISFSSERQTSYKLDTNAH